MSRKILYKAYDRAIPKSVCEEIVRCGDQLKSQQGTVKSQTSDDFEIDEKIRKTNVAFWDDQQWINGLVTHFIAIANRDIWGFEVLVSQGVQYGIYAEAGFYDWHKDEFEWPLGDDHPREEWRGLNRKLSASVNLLDGDEFEGGDIRFKDAWGNEIEVPEGRHQGSVVVFPSYVLHSVTPVTRGVRKSLVSWILGPQFS